MCAERARGGETSFWGDFFPFFCFFTPQVPLRWGSHSDADRIYFFIFGSLKKLSHNFRRKFPGLSLLWSRFLKNVKMVDKIALAFLTTHFPLHFVAYRRVLPYYLISFLISFLIYAGTPVPLRKRSRNIRNHNNKQNYVTVKTK